MYPIPGGLKAGLALFFQGVVPLGSKGYALKILHTKTFTFKFFIVFKRLKLTFFSFEINQKVGPHEHDENIFQFKTDLSSVVYNNYHDGEWKQQRYIEEPIFVEGEAFDIFLLATQLKYHVRRKMCGETV